MLEQWFSILCLQVFMNYMPGCWLGIVVHAHLKAQDWEPQCQSIQTLCFKQFRFQDMWIHEINGKIFYVLWKEITGCFFPLERLVLLMGDEKWKRREPWLLIRNMLNIGETTKTFPLWNSGRGNYSTFYDSEYYKHIIEKTGMGCRTS